MAYDPTNLDQETLSGRVNIVRFLVGDTDATEVQLTDEEITYQLTVANNKPTLAASLVAYALGAKYARLVDTELEGILKEDYSNLSENYYRLATKLKSQAAGINLGVGLPPNVGAGSINPTTPEFYLGQFEYNMDVTRGHNEV